MKQFTIIGILILSVLAFVYWETDINQRESFNRDWKFMLLDESNISENEFHLFEYDDSDWGNDSASDQSYA